MCSERSQHKARMLWQMKRDTGDHISKSFSCLSHDPKKEKDCASLPLPEMSLPTLRSSFQSWYCQPVPSLIILSSEEPSSPSTFSPLHLSPTSCPSLHHPETDNKNARRKVSVPMWWWTTQLSNCLAVENGNLIEERFGYSSCQKSRRQKSLGKLRTTDFSRQFKQALASAKSMVPARHVTQVKEPFCFRNFLAVLSIHSVVGGWSPCQDNILNIQRRKWNRAEVTQATW